MRYDLHKRANASLHSGLDLKQVVKLPPGEELNDWIAVHGMLLSILILILLLVNKVHNNNKYITKVTWNLLTVKIFLILFNFFHTILQKYFYYKI